MEIRQMQPGDTELLAEIDGTIHSSDYFHIEQTGEDLAVGWQLERRPLRTRLAERNAIDDEAAFAVRQMLIGADEGVALVAEHDGNVVGALIAALDEPKGILVLQDIRVDFDYRRQGLGSALLYRLIHETRERGLRAVAARTLSNNFPAAKFLAKAGFELSGLDVKRNSNHDLVKEAATLFWYASLD